MHLADTGREIAPIISMQRTVSAHIAELERVVRQLTDELMHENDRRVRNELQAKIRAAEIALNHYQAALQLEQSLTGDH